MRLLLILLTFFSATYVLANPAVRSLRVDPSYFYSLYPNLSTAQIAEKVVRSAKLANVNTLFLYAYNSTYGAFYKTSYPMTTIEGGYGATDIFGTILKVAKANGLKVFANLPLNDFKNVWQLKPSWRSKKRDGTDYTPVQDTHLLSAWHPSYRSWLAGFYKDILFNYPAIDGIEAVEPMVDYYWNKESDYNPSSNAEFKLRFPYYSLGGSTWLRFRAQGLTNLIALMSEAAHAAGKKSAVVQTWAINSDGTLFTSGSMRDGMGFGFQEILNLTGTVKVDIISAEFMWQQWKAEYGLAHFNPAWTRAAAQAFINFVAGRSFSIIHVEISPFDGSAGTAVSTNLDLQNSIKAVADIAPGVDIYDYNQIESLNAWSALSAWN